MSGVAEPTSKRTVQCWSVIERPIQFTERKSHVSTFGYDALNCRTLATYAGSSTTFGYDATGHLKSVNDTIG